MIACEREAGRENGDIPTLEDLLAERIAGEVVRIARELIREMFEVTEFDPDEGLSFMRSEEVADFLVLPYSSFREISWRASVTFCANYWNGVRHADGYYQTIV